MTEKVPEILNTGTVEKLTEKICNATGWIATLKTPKRLASETLIEEIKNLNISPLEKSALIANSKKIMKEYCNQHDIVAIALEKLSDQSNPDDIDDDWLAVFMDRARLVNSADLKQIWGHILGEECNNPGQFPKALLRILLDMDTSSAKAFLTLCNYTLCVSDPHNYYQPIVLIEEGGHIFGDELSLSTLFDLDSLGLITTKHSIDSFVLELECSSPHFSYCGHNYSLASEWTAPLNVGNVTLTSFGQSLCSVITPVEIPQFMENFLSLNKGLQLKEI